MTRHQVTPLRTFQSCPPKHFLNNPTDLVLDALDGLGVLNPHLAIDPAYRVVYLANPDRSKVALVCGGGFWPRTFPLCIRRWVPCTPLSRSSYPFVTGHGMLSAAVCGNIFASPSAGQVRRAIDLVNNDAGNYTGDVLNFGLAKEQYAATHPDKSDRVKFLIVGDDVAVGREQGKIVGRRGLAGVCLVYKIAGALAARGGSLDEVYSTAEYISSRLGTIGVGLEHCHVPGTAVPDTHLGTNELEIGLGIHNESGHRRVSPVPPLNELIPNLIQTVTSTSDPDRSFVPFKNDGTDRVVLLINNLGGLGELELCAIVGETKKALDKHGIKTMRVLAGSFMTSLNMPGFSITLLLLPEMEREQVVSTDLILSLLDDPNNAPGWKWSSKTEPKSIAERTSVASGTAPPSSQTFLKAPDARSFEIAIERACRAVLAAEGEITDMDKIAGDGDCGLTLSAGASGALQSLNRGAITGDDVINSMIMISNVAEEKMGGTSGALYSIFFSSLAQALARSSATVATIEVWSHALKSALERLYTYTRARPPSRTLIDPLTAFVDALPTGFDDAVKAVQHAAEKTRDIEAKAGRSAYVGGDWLKEQKVPDPGAWGVKVIVEALAR
ncbi:dihydroxyacetone kinase [Chiua virens]|nr:dihydroxyacetone kinase [Chiua virens]